MIWCNIVLLFDFIYIKLKCLLNQNNFILKIPSRSRSRSLKLSIFLLENGNFLQYFMSNFLIHPAGDVLWVFVEPGNVVP